MRPPGPPPPPAAPVLFDVAGPISGAVYAGGPVPGVTPRCSFCDRELHDVRRLAAAGACICADCIATGARLIDEAAERGDDPGPVHLPPRLARAHPGAEEAFDAVVEAFTVVFDATRPQDERAALLEDGDTLAPLLALATQRYPQAGQAVVEEVRFADETYADVRFAILFGQGRFAQEGSARLVEGRWKVTRLTFCQLMARAGLPCPPWSDA